MMIWKFETWDLSVDEKFAVESMIYLKSCVIVATANYAILLIAEKVLSLLQRLYMHIFYFNCKVFVKKVIHLR